MDSYRRETRLVREQRDEESGRERALVRDILRLWAKVKEVRRDRGVANTSVRIVIHKVRKISFSHIRKTLTICVPQESVNLQSDKQDWSSEISREIDEAREIHEANAEEEEKKFNKRMEEWKNMHGKVEK